MKRKPVLMALLAGMAGAATGVATLLLPRSRLSPEERERLRRRLVNERGRTGGATIIDFRDRVIWYTYSVGGVEHTAHQDVSMLAEALPQDPETLIERPATVKYLGSNPANSIVLCEEWTGLRHQPRVTAP